ncbi:MAG TPA: hypothetical protein VGE32_09970 [Cellvibrio sp.]
MKFSCIKYSAATMSIVAITSTAYAECLADNFTGKAFQVGSRDGSKAIQKSWAPKNWQDWIWKGPIRKCTASSNNKCTYQWSEAKTTGYYWELGGGIDPGKIPIIGSALSLFSVNGTYGQNKSWTETFGWTQTFDGNVFVQPVQVVERRWIGGDFKGTFWRTGSSCRPLQWSGTAWVNVPGAHYWWEDGYRWGKWSTNAEQLRYGMYHWWRA